MLYALFALESEVLSQSLNQTRQPFKSYTCFVFQRNHPNHERPCHLRHYLINAIKVLWTPFLVHFCLSLNTANVFLYLAAVVQGWFSHNIKWDEKGRCLEGRNNIQIFKTKRSCDDEAKAGQSLVRPIDRQQSYLRRPASLESFFWQKRHLIHFYRMITRTTKLKLDFRTVSATFKQFNSEMSFGCTDSSWEYMLMWSAAAAFHNETLYSILPVPERLKHWRIVVVLFFFHGLRLQLHNI